MEKKTERKRKIDPRVIWISIGVVAVVIIIAAVMALVNRQVPIPDDYFVSDDTKLVLTMDREQADFVPGEYEPEYTHIVYYHDGDETTGVKIFFQYEDEVAAKSAIDEIDISGWAESKQQNGEYIVFGVRQAQAEGLKTADVRENIEIMCASNAATCYNSEKE